MSTNRNARRRAAALALAASAAALTGGCSFTHQVARPSTPQELESRAGADAAFTDRLGRGSDDVSILYPAIRPLTPPSPARPPELVRLSPTMAAPLREVS